MTLYAESSAVLRWLTVARDADVIEAALKGAGKVVSSRLTLIECRRALRRAQREGALTEAELAKSLEVLARAAAQWGVLEIGVEVAGRAEREYPVEPIRSLDAIHLASALLLRTAIPDLALLTTDRRIRDNAAQLGFLVLPVQAAE